MSDKPSFTSPTDPYLGHTISNEFAIEKTIGIGGMGTVYKAKQNISDRSVAVKILHRHMIDEHMIMRFEQEARIISKLNHPNIVTVFRYGQHEDGALFIAMEYLKGTDLGTMIEQNGHLSVSQALPLMIQMADALGYAHEQKIIHRDIKPENILITKSGRNELAKILDFGISKIVDDDYVRTKTGMLCGSPAYMAPEQWLQERTIDGRLDIYALGCVFYNMLTGQLPFSSDSAAGFMNAHLHEYPPPSLSEVTAGLSGFPTLNDIVLRCVSREPEGRYQDAYTLADDLKKLQMRQHDKSSALDLERTGPIISPTNETQMMGSRGTKTITTTQEIGNEEMKTSKVPILIGAAAALVLAGALVFFALQKSGTAEEPTKPATIVPAPKVAVKKPNILIGMSSPFSGPAKELGRNMKIGVETSFNKANETGGINGRKLELVSLDDGYEPKRTTENMTELLENRKVFAVLGNVGTPTAKVAVPIAMDHSTLFFGGFTGASLLRKDPPDKFVFNYRASYAQETAAMVRYFINVKNIDPSQIAVFAQDDSFGDDGFSGVTKTLRKFGYDTNKTLRVGYKRNTMNVDSAVEAIKDNGKIRAVIMVATYKPSAQFIKKIKDSGRKNVNFAIVSFVGSDALVEEFQQLGPKYGKGVIVTQVVPHPQSRATGVDEYQKLLKKYFPSEKPSFVSLEGYIAASTFIEALKGAGTDLTTDSVINSLQSIKNLDLGVGTVLSFGPSEHQGSQKVWGTRLDKELKYEVIDLE